MSKLLLFMQLILILVAIPVTANTKEVVEASNSSPTEIERDTEMINLGRDLGWIDATCSWFGWGHLSLENAKTSISVITEQIENIHGSDKYLWVIERTAKKYPKCKPVLPKP
ncbi:MAG: penicillin amidase [Prochlorococcus sp.]|jgi:hypothetical protein|tara:strand:+ start:4256 stop:4591 length:336 start_codon:yes stop_codon:yes gene_type:complete